MFANKTIILSRKSTHHQLHVLIIIIIIIIIIHFLDNLDFLMILYMTTNALLAPKSYIFYLVASQSIARSTVAD
jgi:hypothetical protein